MASDPLSPKIGIVRVDSGERFSIPTVRQAANARQRARSAAIVIGAFAAHLCLLLGLDRLDMSHVIVAQKTQEIPVELVTEPPPDQKKQAAKSKTAAAAPAKGAQTPAGSPGPKAEAKAEPKPQPKAQPKPQPKPQAPSEAKAQEKTQAKPEPKQEAKLEPKPEPAPQQEKKPPAEPEPKPPVKAKAAPPKPPAPSKPVAETKPATVPKPAEEKKPPAGETKPAETKPPAAAAKPPQPPKASDQPKLPELATLPPTLQPMPERPMTQAEKPPVQQAGLPPIGPRLPPMSETFQAVAVPSPTEDGDLVLAYKTLVFSKLELAKKFPEEARKRHAHGSAIIAFALDDEGHVTHVTLIELSGDTTLDVASLALVERAAPFPPPPAGAQKEFAAVIEFDAGE